MVSNLRQFSICNSIHITENTISLPALWFYNHLENISLNLIAALPFFFLFIPFHQFSLFNPSVVKPNLQVDCRNVKDSL